MAPLCYRRHRFPPEIIQHAIWLYLRFTLSYRDVEDLLGERGLDISSPTRGTPKKVRLAEATAALHVAEAFMPHRNPFEWRNEIGVVVWAEAGRCSRSTAGSDRHILRTRSTM